MPAHYTEPQKAEFKQVFAARRKRQILLAAVLIPIVIAMAMTDGRHAVLGIPAGVVMGVALAATLGGVIFSLVNWRCPACSGYLGKAINPNFCVKCGVELS